jgi:hypothetical protein
MSSQKPKRGESRPRIIVNGQEISLESGGLTVEPVRRKQGISCGCILLTLTIILPLAVGAVAVYSAIIGFTADNPFSQLFASITGITPPESVEIAGDASRFDPLEGLEQAQALAGEDAQLAAISAYYVRVDGTMDLHADYTPRPYTDYEFLRPIPRPDDAPPVGVGGSTNGQWYEPITVKAYEPGQRRRVTRTGGGISTSYDYVNKGLLKEVSDPTTTPFEDPVELPQCTFVELWEVALTKDAPRDAVAIIEYDVDGYTFNISGVVYLRFDHDCKLQD